MPPVSPRIAALERDLAAGNEAALAAFWREVADRGAPLIEPLPGDDLRCLVTFIWRAAGSEGETRPVVVLTATPTGGWLEALAVAVLVDALDLPTRGRELRCAAPFTTFLTQELLPWVHQRYWVTDDPSRTVVGGISAAGRTAALAGLRHPDRFGNVLSQSGWVDPGGAQLGVEGGDAEPEWLARQFASRPRLPLRFYLDAGVFEGNLLAANRHLRTVLQARGYEVHYAEFVGAHSWACWRGTLADGLLALLGDRRDAH